MAESDIAILALINYMEAFTGRFREFVKKHAKAAIRDAVGHPAKEVALNFQFSSHKNKIICLKMWMTSDKNCKKLATETLRNIFLNPAEEERARALMIELVEFKEGRDPRPGSEIKVTLLGVSTLDESAQESIVPSILSIITPDISRGSLDALVDTLITAEKHCPKLLLRHID
jgi:hypothetical protein